jgi:hypothetical protein
MKMWKPLMAAALILGLQGLCRATLVTTDSGLGQCNNDTPVTPPYFEDDECSSIDIFTQGGAVIAFCQLPGGDWLVWNSGVEQGTVSSEVMASMTEGTCRDDRWDHPLIRGLHNGASTGLLEGMGF